MKYFAMLNGQWTDAMWSYTLEDIRARVRMRAHQGSWRVFELVEVRSY